MSATRRKIGLALALASTLLLSACAASTSPQEAPQRLGVSDDAALPDAEQLHAIIEEMQENTGVPGVAVRVTSEANAGVTAVLGTSDTELALEPNTRFAYRSITKSFVATVVLQLADEQRLDLEAPISDYLSEVPGGGEITVAELGNMRSGLPNYSANPKLGALLMEDPLREPAVSELLELAFSQPNEFEAGSAYEYSNTNTLLLGELIEEVTGDDWQVAVDQRILRPLGLSTVHYGFDSEPNTASPFQVAPDEAPELLPTAAPGWFGAAGALTGSVEDLARWGRALGNGSLVNASTQEWRIHTLGPIGDDSASPEYDHYGFGMGEIDGWIGHTGNGLGFEALVMHEPKRDLTVAILMNGTGADANMPAGLFREILKVVPAAVTEA